MNKYNPKEIENRWQKYWEKHGTFSVKEDTNKQKLYTLIEFPYPSGAGLHVGHPRPFTAMDVISRKKRMEGFNVLYPIGFDAFGLPTENYAIKTGRPPAEVTAENIATFTRQLKSLGFSFDWDRIVDTTDPTYYKWTQWIFLQLFKHGLAYKKNQPINWCPSCKIGLANEEVVDGKCERCGTPVEQKNKEQWMLGITKYADSLLEGLKHVDYIPPARIQQENWIGRSEGINFKHRVKDLNIEFEVYDSVPQTFLAQTFVIIAPEHPLVKKFVEGTEQEKSVMEFVEKIKKKKIAGKFNIDEDMEGIFTGRYSENYMRTGRDLPIWVASFALMDYGTGIVGCSAHDERDFIFAKKYNIPLKVVMLPPDEAQVEQVRNLEVCYHHAPEAVLQEPIEFKGRAWGEARTDIIDFVEKKNFGRRAVHYKLRDWVFSRQRYWGEPIPLVYCTNCESRIRNNESGIMNELSEGEKTNPGWISLPESELPLELPKVEKYQPTDTGESPLAAMTDWVKTKCPKCGGEARRETDTMPNWAGSSWYFLRYTDPTNGAMLASPDKLKYWMPVDWYNGGMEHTVLHLLYSRFWNQFLFDIGVIPNREPIQKMREPYMKRTSHGMILAKGGEKMSKSKGNVVNPDEMVDKFGADALRTYIMFMGPFDQAVEWDTDGLVGVRRFLERVWRLQEKLETRNWKLGNKEIAKLEIGNKKLVSSLHQTIKKVTEDIDAMRFNTAVARMMELTNDMTKEKTISPIAYCLLIQLLSPFAPHICEELWNLTDNDGTVAFAPWPMYDPALIVADTVTLAIQVNGKVRANIEVAADIDEAEAKRVALEHENVKKWLDGKEPKKVIYVKGKLVSVVV